jgi:hypothetical protein
MDQQKILSGNGNAPVAENALTPETGSGDGSSGLEQLREEIVGGFLYTHSRANSNSSRILEAASFLYSLIELLEEKGLISIAELDERKTTVAQRVKERFLAKGMGVHLQEPERDKYAVQGTVEIDCENRVHLCKAACCRLCFPLSKQDIDEGVVKWDLRFPYIIAQDDDGYCQHLNCTNHSCTIYQHRPLPCRTFDCRKDERIWLDFENMVVNPNLEAMFPTDPSYGPSETYLESSTEKASPGENGRSSQ